MTRKFSALLAERVATILVLTFLATYGAGSVGLTLHASDQFSLAQRSLVAAVAAVVQLLLGVFVGPNVGDPSTPSLLPTALLKRLGGLPAPAQQQIVVALDDVVQHLAEKYPDVKLSADEVAKALLDHAVQPPKA